MDKSTVWLYPPLHASTWLRIYRLGVTNSGCGLDVVNWRLTLRFDIWTQYLLCSKWRVNYPTFLQTKYIGSRTAKTKFGIGAQQARISWPAYVVQVINCKLYQSFREVFKRQGQKKWIPESDSWVGPGVVWSIWPCKDSSDNLSGKICPPAPSVWSELHMQLTNWFFLSNICLKFWHKSDWCRVDVINGLFSENQLGRIYKHTEQNSIGLAVG